MIASRSLLFRRSGYHGIVFSLSECGIIDRNQSSRLHDSFVTFFKAYYSNGRATLSNANASINVNTYRTIKIESAPDQTVHESGQRMSLNDIISFDGNKFGVRDFVSFNITPEPGPLISEKSVLLASKTISSMSPQPKVSPRGNHILVSFGQIKALIGQSKGLLFDAQNPSIKLFSEEIAERIENKMTHFRANTFTDDDFEIIFLEEILREVTDAWERRFKIYKRIVDSLSESSSNNEFESEIKRISPIKDSLKGFDIQIKEHIESLEELLADDEKMLGLLLTEQEAARKRVQTIDSTLHSAVEIVLEHYIRQLNRLSHQVNYLLMRIQSKVELIEVSIDVYRNRLISMNVNLSIAAVSLASATTIAGFFGMNVVNGFENSLTAFPAIICSSLFFGGGISYYCARYLSMSHSKAQAQKYVLELETMNKLLRDINLDTTDLVLKMVASDQKNVGHSELGVADFRDKIMTLCPDGDRFTYEELHFLFSVIDKNRDNRVQKDEFLSLFDTKDDIITKN